MVLEQPVRQRRRFGDGVLHHLGRGVRVGIQSRDIVFHVERGCLERNALFTVVDFCVNNGAYVVVTRAVDGGGLMSPRGKIVGPVLVQILLSRVVVLVALLFAWNKPKSELRKASPRNIFFAMPQDVRILPNLLAVVVTVTRLDQCSHQDQTPSRHETMQTLAKLGLLKTFVIRPAMPCLFVPSHNFPFPNRANGGNEKWPRR